MQSLLLQVLILPSGMFRALDAKSLSTQTLCLSKWSDEHRPENTELMMVLLFFSPVKQTHEV